jgi:cellulose synthase/poly-beta-1,6-N-acetylglucosamine synthase-like glycosyltransferase
MSKSLEPTVLATAARIFLIAATGFLATFYVIISYFAFSKSRTSKHCENIQRVSVVIPAYNEDGVIDHLLTDLKNSSFPIAETIVLDDHSTDGTYDVAKKMNATVVRNERKLGKAATLNEGAKIAKEDIIIVFDADNRPENDCIKNLLNHFDSKNVGIVTGVTKSSSDGLVSKLAALEFGLHFYLFQRFSARFNFFPILHGAHFGIRRELASFFDEDALTEDFDISVKMVCKGYRIEFEPLAISWVSPPPSFSLFARQRERWIRGAVQASRRNKGFSRKVFPHVGFLGLFVTALGYLLPLVWAATLTFIFISYFLGEFLLMSVAIFATMIYTTIAFAANSVAGNRTNDMIALPFLGYFYFFFVVWFFMKSAVLEYLGFKPKFDKIPHK